MYYARILAWLLELIQPKPKHKTESGVATGTDPPTPPPSLILRRDGDMMLWQEKAGSRYINYVLSLAWLLRLTPLLLAIAQA